jgi:hypothetical protein
LEAISGRKSIHLDMESIARRRLHVIHTHLLPPPPGLHRVYVITMVWSRYDLILI